MCSKNEEWSKHFLPLFFRDQDCLDEVLEKQAEMIRYLQQHNSNLGKRIVEMTQQNIQREQRSKWFLSYQVSWYRTFAEVDVVDFKSSWDVLY